MKNKSLISLVLVSLACWLPSSHAAPQYKTITPILSLLLSGGSGQAYRYRVIGESQGVSFSGEICSLNNQFFIDGTFPGGTARTWFTPSSRTDGTTSMFGDIDGGCTQSGEGTYTVIINAGGSGTITWTDYATLYCPEPINERIETFVLTLQPAPDLVCH